MSDDAVVGDDGSAYLFWLAEQIPFACLDIWAGSKLANAEPAMAQWGFISLLRRQ